MSNYCRQHDVRVSKSSIFSVIEAHQSCFLDSMGGQWFVYIYLHNSTFYSERMTLDMAITGTTIFTCIIWLVSDLDIYNMGCIGTYETTLYHKTKCTLSFFHTIITSQFSVNTTELYIVLMYVLLYILDILTFANLFVALNIFFLFMLYPFYKKCCWILIYTKWFLN